MKELDELLKKVEELSDFAHRIKLLTNLEPKEFLDQLTKYGLANEPQKVKVPVFVAKWIELCKEKADASSCLNGYYEIGNGTIVRPRGFSDEFYDWLADCNHMDDLTRAWLDGYEVEQEQKWVVKSNQLYFTGVTQLIAHDPLTYNFVKDQKHAHIFDDKKSAEKEASFFDGTIEKVEE